VNRPKPGAVEERTAPDILTAEDRRIRGRVPYGVESRDLGGWREVIEPGALDNAQFDDLVVTVDHAGVPLGRYPTTLELEDRSDGLHWSVSPPDSRADVREAVERGDLRAGSWRMRVKRDEWRGDTRHIHEIAELRDVSIVTAPAYRDAVVELRSQPDPGEAQEDTMGAEPITDTTVEDRAEPTTGGLQVEDRVAVTRDRPRGLAEEFRAAGFPGETATISWQAFEDRAVTWSGSVDTMNRVRRDAAPLGFDTRYAWPAFPRVAVDAGVTSVDVVTQTARSLATATNVVRAIDAVTNKPETGSTLTVNATSLKQVATVQSGIPNVYLESAAVNSSSRRFEARLEAFGQPDSGRGRDGGLSGAGHRRHPRQHPQVHHDAAGRGLRARHAAAHPGER
jgi:HK97 family phage prohead protease